MVIHDGVYVVTDEIFDETIILCQDNGSSFGITGYRFKAIIDKRIKVALERLTLPGYENNQNAIDAARWRKARKAGVIFAKDIFPTKLDTPPGHGTCMPGFVGDIFADQYIDSLPND